MIFTGDLGAVGQHILLELLVRKGSMISARFIRDCGLLIFDSQTQDTHSGGSGCGCSASVLAAYILPMIASGTWKRVLFVPTGALLSKTSFNEGDSIPGIAHGLVVLADMLKATRKRRLNDYGLLECILGGRTDLRPGPDSYWIKRS